MKPLAALAGLVILVAGCAAEPSLRVQATVLDEVDVISVPALATVTVDLDAGFPAAPEALAPPDRPPVTGPGSFSTVAEIAVREGDRVHVGQMLARLDDRLLRAGLRAAEADAEVAAAQVEVLIAAQGKTDDAAQEIADQRGEVKQALTELRAKRTEVRKAIKQLTRTRDKLTKQRATLRSQRAELRAQLGQLRQALELVPPEAPDRPGLEAGIAKLTRAINQLSAGLKKLDAGLSELTRGLKQARAGLRQLDSGIAKANDGLIELDDAAAEVRDARAQLDRLHRLAEVAVDSTAVGVDLARAQLDQATIVALRAGTVIALASAGDQLAPGASLVTLRPDGPSRLRTWLSPTQAALVCPGDRATVQTDWGEDVTAEVSRIGTTAEFPPTGQATDEVHLTRAFAVELNTTTTLPAGAPATVTLHPCRPGPAATPEGESHGTS